jgi:ubiquinone biosynthesis protein Coq4
MNPLNMAKAARAFWRITMDPNRLNEVFELAYSLADDKVMGEMVDYVKRDATGAQALAEKTRLRVDLNELRHLPEGTLGRVFADNMIAQGLDPAAIPTLPSDDDKEYIQAHLFETHDVWHAVTGFGTDVPGELGLQAFYMAQLIGKLPTAILASGFLNTLLFNHDERGPRMDEIARGWQMGRKARQLFGVRWDKLWSTPLTEVRRALGLEPGVAHTVSLAA